MTSLRRIFKPTREASKVPNYILVLLMLGFALFPIVILGFNSLKSSAEIGLNPLGPPSTWIFENYPTAWVEGNFARTMRNSAFLVVMTVSLQIVLCGMAAYALARLKPPGSNAFMVVMLVGTTVPIWLYIVPLFILWRSLGLLNNLFGLVLIYTAGGAPFAIFLLRAFMLQIHPDFEDAARLDGAGEFQVLRHVVLPLTWPGFLTVALISSLGTWSEYQLALIFVTDPDFFPVTTSYSAFVGRFSRDWGLTSAAAVMMIAPVLAIFLSLQRQFIDGLTQGGVKF
ncbi:MAG: carbohydrate ABC transporter permease [Chloroflexota bacterium]